MAKAVFEQLKIMNYELREKGKLSDIANITMGQSPDGKSYNENKEGIIFYQGCTDFGDRFPKERLCTTAPTRFAEIGDVLLSVRAPVGTMNIANTKCCIGRGLAALNSKENYNCFLYFVVKDLMPYFNRINNSGTTFGAITKDDLFSLAVEIPPKESIMRFEKIAKPMFDKQFLIAKQNENLTTLRDYLLPLLMNGQVSVNYHLSDY
ncbi:MAG: restriction endonuclease subunit S [Bacteroidales bacterium]|jgi:type I restriction enzyme S subunit|nr:restriction endonuclease subunit S [Bacteroidales bacterium]